MLDHAIHRAGRDGFSINGGRRSTGYIGKTSHMSRASTPFNGLNAKGHGGKYGKYVTQPPGHYVSQKNAMVETRGTQGENVCPSVISIGSMVRKKYSGAAHNVIQSITPENPNPADYSHEMYLHAKRARNICVVDVNNSSAHADDTHRKTCSYAKTLGEPMEGHEYVTYVRKSCADSTQPTAALN